MTKGRQGVFGSTNIIDPIKVIFYFEVKWQLQVDASKKLSFFGTQKNLLEKKLVKCLQKNSLNKIKSQKPQKVYYGPLSIFFRLG